jgi:hypothetical protein
MVAVLSISVLGDSSMIQKFGKVRPIFEGRI